jgi:dipeptidyl aminopeptidase/acylaminoacyl peptidase
MVFCGVMMFLSIGACLSATDFAKSQENPFGSSLVQGDVISAKSCFSGKFETYTSWLTFIEKKNKSHEGFSLAAVKDRWPEKDFDQYKRSLKCANFIYMSGGYKVGGFVVAPHEKANRDLPVVIFNRGGTGRFGNISLASMFNYIFPIAKEGFVVIGSQYREGLGIPGTEGGGFDEFGGEDINDVIKILDIAKHVPGADTERIGVFGGSRGGMMSFLLAKESGVNLDAIVVVAPAADLLGDLERRPEMEKVYRKRIPFYLSKKEELLKKRSVIYWVEELPADLPILIMHGQSDERVGASVSLDLADELQEKGRPYQLFIFNDDNHFLSGNHDKVIIETVEWFEQHLSSVND